MMNLTNCASSCKNKNKKNHPHVVPNSFSVVSVKHKYRTFVFLAGTEAYKLKKSSINTQRVTIKVFKVHTFCE